MDECLCVKEHRPAVLEPESHHLWPVYLGGPEHQSTMVKLCNTTHSNVHRILRAMIKADKWLPRKAGQPAYSHHIATLGFQAWTAAGKPRELPRALVSSGHEDHHDGRRDPRALD